MGGSFLEFKPSLSSISVTCASTVRCEMRSIRDVASGDLVRVEACDLRLPFREAYLGFGPYEGRAQRRQPVLHGEGDLRNSRTIRLVPIATAGNRTTD
jgi:hypothetical protein